MKKYLLILILMCCVWVSKGQITFQKIIGGTSIDYGTCVQQTMDGGYVIFGSASGIGAYYDVYLIKTDANGDTLWTKTFGGVGTNDMGYEVQQTADTGYIVTGIYNYSGASDIYLIKTNSSGDTLWTKTFGSVGDDAGYSIKQTNDGGYVITGFIQYGSVNSDVFLCKTDSTGNVIWLKTFGGTIGKEVQQTADGGFVIVGNYENNNANDVYLIKTDANGNSSWIKRYGGAGTDEGHSVRQTTDGGFIITGFTTSLAGANSDVYLIKTDTIGNVLWSKTYGDIDIDWGYEVEQTSDGGYIIAGGTDGFSALSYDVYLIKTDTAGNIVWSKTYGGGGVDEAQSIKQTTDGGYVITGQTYGNGASGLRVYLAKVDSYGNSGCMQANPATVVNPRAITGANFIANNVNVLFPVTNNPTIVGSRGSVTTLCTNTGVASSTLEKVGMGIFPNPSPGVFQVTYNLQQNLSATLTIIDITGKVIYTQTLPTRSTMQTITLPYIAAGLYNCVITSGDKRVSRKIAVVRP